MTDLTKMTKEELLAELKTYVLILKNSLPKEMPLVISKSIDPTRAVLLREACLYRISEISGPTCKAFEEDNLIVASILCRSIMETEALFWKLHDKLDIAIKNRDIKDIHNFLTKCLLGVKSEKLKKMKAPVKVEMIVDPINVLTFIDNLEKKVTNYRFHYDNLSELSHPNAAGTVDVYVQIDWVAKIARFGKNKKRLDYNPSLMLLVTSLKAFLDVYDHTAKLLEQFIPLCDELLSLPKNNVILTEL